MGSHLSLFELFVHLLQGRPCTHFSASLRWKVPLTSPQPSMATRITRQERWRSPRTRQLEQLDSPAEPSRSASPHGDHKARDEWASAPILLPDRMDSDLSMATTTSSPSTPVAALQTRSGPSPRSPREPCAMHAATEIGVEARRTATERAKESPLLRAPRVEGSTLRTVPSTAQAQALRTTLFYASLDGRIHDGIDDKHRALKPPRVRESAARVARSSRERPIPALASEGTSRWPWTAAVKRRLCKRARARRQDRQRASPGVSASASRTAL